MMALRKQCGKTPTGSPCTTSRRKRKERRKLVESMQATGTMTTTMVQRMRVYIEELHV